MGAIFSLNNIPNAWNRVFHPEVTPGPLEEASWDPHFGFKKQRKMRVMLATEEELMSSKVPDYLRDYCSYIVLRILACKEDHWPWVLFCQHLVQTYKECLMDDYILRIKEFERERRLRVIQQKYTLKKQAVAIRKEKRAARERKLLEQKKMLEAAG